MLSVTLTMDLHRYSPLPSLGPQGSLRVRGAPPARLPSLVLTCRVAVLRRVETLVRERERVREKLEYLMAVAALATDPHASAHDQWTLYLRNVRQLKPAQVVEAVRST